MLQQMEPDLDDDEIEDTFKISFENTRKRKVIENYYCSGFKKLCIVKFVNLPEFSKAPSADVLMQSLAASSGSLNQLGGSVEHLGVPRLPAPSQPQITQFMSSSQQSLRSTASRSSVTSSSDIADQPVVAPKFGTTGGQPKQMIKTVEMPQVGGYSTTTQLARANLDPKLNPTLVAISGSQPAPLPTPGLQAAAARKITKAFDPQSQQAQHNLQTGDWGAAILQGAAAAAASTANPTQRSQQSGDTTQPVQSTQSR